MIRRAPRLACTSDDDGLDRPARSASRPRHVRRIEGGDVYDPSGQRCTGRSGGFDLDALAAVHAP